MTQVAFCACHFNQTVQLSLVHVSGFTFGGPRFGYHYIIIKFAYKVFQLCHRQMAVPRHMAMANQSTDFISSFLHK